MTGNFTLEGTAWEKSGRSEVIDAIDRPPLLWRLGVGTNWWVTLEQCSKSLLIDDYRGLYYPTIWDYTTQDIGDYNKFNNPRTGKPYEME